MSSSLSSIEMEKPSTSAVNANVNLNVDPTLQTPAVLTVSEEKSKVEEEGESSAGKNDHSVKSYSNGTVHGIESSDVSLNTGNIATITSAGAGTGTTVIESDDNDMKGGDNEISDEPDDEEDVYINYLYILPPRQKQPSTDTSSSSAQQDTPTSLLSSALALPPLRYDEHVQSIRAALMDIIQYTHYTNYRLELEIFDLPNASSTHRQSHTQEEPLPRTTSQPPANGISSSISNFTSNTTTGKDAVVSIPIQFQQYANTEAAPIALDDYGDLHVISQHVPVSNDDVQPNRSDKRIIGLRIVLERYDMSSLKEHIQRVRYLLNSGNIPTLTTLHEPTTSTIGNDDSNNDIIEETRDSNIDTNSKHQEQQQKQLPTPKESSNDDSKNHSSRKDAVTTSTSNHISESNTLPDIQYIPNNIIVDGTNLQDFFYLVFGEDRQFIHSDFNKNRQHSENNTSLIVTTNNHKSTNKNHHKKYKHHQKKNGNGDKNKSYNNIGTKSSITSNNNHHDDGNHSYTSIKQYMQRYNELEEIIRTKICIQYSGYHPPPPYRKLFGDLAYLIVTIPSSTDISKSDETVTSNNMIPKNDTVVHITCTTFGFYVNRSIDADHVFDPSPLVPDSYFAHSLLDCLLYASIEFRTLWTKAINAAKERNDMNQISLFNTPSQLNIPNSNYQSIIRAAIRGDFTGFESITSAIQVSHETFETTIVVPSWLMPNFDKYIKQQQQYKLSDRNFFHNYNLQRVELELQKTYGVEIRNGAVRDWNEELQLAREMPTSTPQERFERARLIHKVMIEFGEASLLGVMAIADGHITPMNPNESIRSQVYLFNNIFISRGVDTGPETFKITRGDRAARKASNRDLQCIGIFHRMEHNQRNDNLYTLATVLIDFLGTRYVCQSILPGILIGDKSHTLLYGSVESGIPLKWDAALEQCLEDKLGQSFMIAPRPIYRSPLTQSRVDELDEIRQQNGPLNNMSNEIKKNNRLQVNYDDIINTCVAIEAKGILGSDQRRYMLDISRLTPRDANWVSKDDGGTGKYEDVYESYTRQPTLKHFHLIPPSLNDDEWVMCVLRPELITRFTQIRMKQFIEQSKINNNVTPTTSKEDIETIKSESTLEKGSNAVTLATESNMDTTAFLKTLKLNLNVFLPHVRYDTDMEQLKADEKLVRDVAEYLWDDILPKITLAIREGAVNQLPVDGKSLTEFLHRNGVNCRYLGRLAILAQEQEEKDLRVEADLKLGKLTSIDRKTMPKCWLELLECEMVARSAKHVLDDYLTAYGGIAALKPAQTIASFLSALISEAEETAAQTEIRKSKQLSNNEPDDDDFATLTIVDICGTGDGVSACIKSRSEVWHDIEVEIGRRFRYQLSLFNRGNKTHRAVYLPLLRRVCQRTGIKLLAKKYVVGGKCLCGGGFSLSGKLVPSYPISPLDIVEVVPLMKHAAAYSEGFQPCSVTATMVSLPPLQISLSDARATLERAHIQANGRILGKALELAQEAGALYQRVTENAAHPGVIESIDLMATIFLEAGDPINAVLNGEKALALTLQSSGLDSAAAFHSHQLLFQMLFAAHEMERATKHLRAAMFLLELMAGPHHTEHYTAYHKLGTVYSHAEFNGKYLTTALECFHEATKRESCDRLMDGFMIKNYAKTLMELENYAEALEYETKANHTLTMFLGKNHKMTQDSDVTVQLYSKLVSEKGNRIVHDHKKSNDPKLEAEAAAIADSIAADLVAEEERHSKKRVDKKKRSKK